MCVCSVDASKNVERDSFARRRRRRRRPARADDAARETAMDSSVAPRSASASERRACAAQRACARERERERERETVRFARDASERRATKRARRPSELSLSLSQLARLSRAERGVRESPRRARHETNPSGSNSPKVGENRI